MKTTIPLFIGLVSGIALMLVFGSQLNLGTMSGGGNPMSEGEKEPLYWVAPMDKNYRRDGPGLSPMGMDLVPVYEEDVSGGDDNSIKISPVVENNLGVKLAYATKDPLVLPIKTLGVVQFDESKISHVHSRVEGWIERLGVSASGDKVSKGQTLFELYSPTLVSAQEEYLAALRSKNRNLIRASSSRLYALGLSESQVLALAKRNKVNQTVSITAEHDGVVIGLNVRRGMYIKPAMEVLSFGSLNSVWVAGEVFERQAYLIQQGQSVEARFNAFPGEVWKGSVNYIYPELDKQTRTLKLRIRLINDDQRLKPNMLADLNILGDVPSDGVNIPLEALIKAGDHARVVKSLGEGRYQSVWVQPGLEGKASKETVANVVYNQSRVQILKGLEEGDVVVTSAHFLIDSESNTGADFMRMQEAQALGEAPGSKDNNKVRTTGMVHEVKGHMGLVSLTHEPIPEWDWPEMKMDFAVAEGIDLTDFKPGETLKIEIEKLGDWDFQISRIGDEVDQMEMDSGLMKMNHSAIDQADMASESASGVAQ